MNRLMRSVTVGAWVHDLLLIARRPTRVCNISFICMYSPKCTIGGEDY